MSATTRPGRGDSTTTRSPSSTASSTSCVTSTTVRGSCGEHPREPGLHLRARDRVERRERLVQRQHRLAGQQRAQERDPLAHAARQLVRPRLLEPATGRSARTRVAPGRAPAGARLPAPAAPARRCRARRATAAAGRAVASAPPAAAARCRRPAAAARRSARAASSCRSRWARPRRLSPRSSPSATDPATPAPARRRDAPRTFGKRPRTRSTDARPRQRLDEILQLVRPPAVGRVQLGHSNGRKRAHEVVHFRGQKSERNQIIVVFTGIYGSSKWTNTGTQTETTQRPIRGSRFSLTFSMHQLSSGRLLAKHDRNAGTCRGLHFHRRWRKTWRLSIWRKGLGRRLP